MRRQIQILNQILNSKLADLRLFGRAELKGPVLNILLERLPGDAVDVQQVMEVIRTAVEASMVQGFRKVNVYLWCRGQETDTPEWRESFTVDPLPFPHLQTPSSRIMHYRQDYPGMRVLFFCLGIGFSGFYLLGGQQGLDLIPTAVALLFGLIFPWFKRSWVAQLPPLFRSIGFSMGLVLAGILTVLIWRQGWSVTYRVLSLLAIFLLGLGS